MSAAADAQVGSEIDTLQPRGDHSVGNRAPKD
jgi:hypothetical protein